MPTFLSSPVHRLAALGGVVLLTAAGQAAATFANSPALGLGAGYPDLKVDGIGLSYAYNNGTDSVLTYNYDATPPFFGAAGSYYATDGGSPIDYIPISFDATINLNNGALNMSLPNSFSITDINTTNVLVAGDIFSFGVAQKSDPTQGTFEALLTVNESTLGFTGTIGVIFNAVAINDADWYLADSDFATTDYTSAADVAVPAPAPATVALLGLGLIALQVRRRRSPGGEHNA